jgi:hypothetical protein
MKGDGAFGMITHKYALIRTLHEKNTIILHDDELFGAEVKTHCHKTSRHQKSC